VATFTRLPSGSWRAQIRKTGHEPIGKTFDSKALAREWAETMEGDREAIDAFPDAEARRRTVGIAIDAYMLAYSGRDEGIVSRLAWWKANYGAVPLAQFTPAKRNDGLRDLSLERAKHCNGPGRTMKALPRAKSPATLNRYAQAISSVLSWCVDEGWLAKNPLLGLKRRKEPRGRVRYLDDAERTALLAACDESEWSDLALLVKLALSTGARRGELLALRWQDIDLKAGLARVPQTKNDEPRVLPLVEPVRKLLEAKARPIKGGLLFPARHDATQPNTSCRLHWNAAVKAAALVDFRFHDLRHSCASYLAMNGATPLEIGDVLGHKTLAMVRRYSHLSAAHKQKLVERVLGDKV
jgi:integrase